MSKSKRWKSQLFTNIKTIADLKGRKVGVAFGGTGDLYLRTVLKKNGIGINDVQRINVRPPSFVSIFDSGGVEAITAWEPAFTRLLDKVKGSRVVVRGGEDHPALAPAPLHPPLPSLRVPARRNERRRASGFRHCAGSRGGTTWPGSLPAPA